MENRLVLPFVKSKRATNTLSADDFAALMMEHKMYFYKMAFSYVKDEQKALDLIQEATYKGLVNLSTLHEDKYFKTWMTRILIHTALNSIKKERRFSLVELVELPMASSRTISTEVKLDLYDAIDELRPVYKMVIILRYFNDYTLDEIASLMDLPLNTVKSYLKRAKLELKNLLKEELNDE